LVDEGPTPANKVAEVDNNAAVKGRDVYIADQLAE
jgi:hypothetical protein